MNLSIVPNPFGAELDGDGDPCCYVHRVDLRRHSAKPILLHAQRVLRDGKVKVTYEEGAVEVPDLPAYRRLLRTGQILPATPATAALVGMVWEPVEEALARYRAIRIKQFLATTGRLPPWAATPEESLWSSTYLV